MSSLSSPSKEEIYNLIKSQKNGMTLDDLAQQYQISPHNPSVLLFIAQLLADRKVKQERRGEKLYCVAVETDDKEAVREERRDY